MKPFQVLIRRDVLERGIEEASLLILDWSPDLDFMPPADA